MSELFDEKMLNGQFGISIPQTTEYSLTVDNIDFRSDDAFEQVNDGIVCGRVIGASSDNNFHRLYVKKLWDCIVYGQHMSEIINSIYIRSSNGVVDQDTHIVIYGKIHGGAGVVRTGSNISAEGKMDRYNRFVAKRVSIDGTELQVQTEWTDVSLFVIPLLIIFAIIGLRMISPALMNLGQYLTTLLIPFSAGFIGVLRFVGKKMRYYVPLSRRLKWALIGGSIFSVITAMIMRG